MWIRLANLDALSQRRMPPATPSRCAPMRLKPAAFTLVELVLVLAVLAILMAAAAPNLRGWSRNAKLRDATDQVLASVRYARAQAIHDAVPYHLSVDPTGSTVQVLRQGGAQFVPVDDARARPVVLPDGFVLEIERLDATAARGVAFFPDGRTTPARIVLTSPWGHQTILSAPTAAQPFELLASAGGAP